MKNRKHVTVVYTADGVSEQIDGNKSIILVQDAAGELDLAAVNIEGLDDVCDVLQKALNTANRKKRWVSYRLRAGNWRNTIMRS